MNPKIPHKRLGTLLRLASAAAFGGLLLLNLSTGGLYQFGRFQLLLLSLSALSLLLSIRALRIAGSRVLARSRRDSPSIASRIRSSRTSVVFYALWFAALVSVGEMAYVMYTNEITRYRLLSSSLMWRIPTGYALMFAVLIGVCWAVRRRRFQAFVAAGFFVIACGWLPIAIHGLANWAILLLAAGIAIRFTRLSTDYFALMDLLRRRSAPAAVAITVAASAAFYTAPILSEREALSRLPVARTDRPNVLLMVLDTVRAKSLSLYGYPRLTSPQLSAFGRRGVVFDHAYSTASWTLPSHGSMFTGRWPHELSAGFRTALDSTFPTLAETLAGHGYATAGFVSNVWYGGAQYGLARGFAHYEDEVTTPLTSIASTSLGRLILEASENAALLESDGALGRKNAAAVNQSFLAWLGRVGTHRPFFAFLNYSDAHSPYRSSPAFSEQFSDGSRTNDVDAKPADAWSADEIRELNAAYDSAIAFLDHELGRLFGALEQKGIIQDTIVIVTSDHGEQFGEHGLLDHVNSLYPALLHVPLMIVYPGVVPEGARFNEPVSLRDLPATILSLAGIREPVPLAGKPLLMPTPAVTSQSLGKRAVLAEVELVLDSTVPTWSPARQGPMKSILFEEWQYIVNLGNGHEELFNLSNDPEAAANLSGSERQRLLDARGHLERELAPFERKRVARNLDKWR